MKDLHARWFDPGTAADVAAAINAKRAKNKQVSPAWVKAQWAKAQKRGELPPGFLRPTNGFRANQAAILLRFMEVKTGRAA